MVRTAIVVMMTASVTITVGVKRMSAGETLVPHVISAHRGGWRSNQLFKRRLITCKRGTIGTAAIDRFLTALDIAHSEPEHATAAMSGEERSDGGIVLVRVINLESYQYAAGVLIVLVAQEEMGECIVAVYAKHFVKLNQVVSMPG